MFTTHLTEAQCSSCYDLPGSRFEVPFQSGLDSFRADGFVKHRIEGPSTPEIAKPARVFAYCSGEVLVFAGLSGLKGGGMMIARLITSRSIPSRALAAAPPKSL